MTGRELLAELRKPGEVVIWIPQIGGYLPVMKVALRNTLEACVDLDGLDILAGWDDDRLFVIEDFGPISDLPGT